MAEDETISTVVPDNRVITSPLGKEDNDALAEVFQGHWDAIDKAEAESPPSAAPVENDKPVEKPKEVPRQEEAETPAEPKASKKKLSETASAPSSKDLDEILDGPQKPVEAPPAKPASVSAEDVDALELHPRAPESQKSQFKQLKEIAKSSIEQAKTFRSKLAPLASEMGIELGDDVESALDQFAQKVREAKIGVDPQLQREVEYYRARDAAKGLTDSVTFNRQFRQPLDQKFNEVLGKIYRHLPGDQAANKENWLDPLLTNFRPGSTNSQSLDEKWWRQQIDAIQSDGIEKQAIWGDIVELRKLQDKWAETAVEIARNPVTLEKLKEADTQQYISDYDFQVRDETQKVLDSDSEYATYKSLRDRVQKGESDEAEKKEWQKIADEFTQTLSNVNSGPRAASRVAMQNLKLRREVAELESVRKENQQLRKELRTRRGILDAPVKSSAGRGSGTAPPKSNGQRLSDTKRPDFSSLGN